MVGTEHRSLAKEVFAVHRWANSLASLLKKVSMAQIQTMYLKVLVKHRKVKIECIVLYLKLVYSACMNAFTFGSV